MQKNSKRSQVNEMYGNGSTLEEIRDKLDYESISDVNRVLNQIGIKTGRAKQVSEEQKEHIKKLYDDGLNGKQIAKLMEISNTTVYNILRGKNCCNYITVNKSEKNELPVPVIHQKKVILPRVQINEKSYVDVFKIVGGY